MSALQDAGIGELKKCLRHSSHYVTGLVAGLGLGFISFPIFTRAFTVAEYGIVDLAQKILLLLTAFSKLGLQNSALRFYNDNAFRADQDAGRRYYATLFFGVSLAACLVAGLFIAAMRLFPELVPDARIRGIIALLAALGILRAMMSMLCSFLRIEERTKTYNVVTVTTRAATIAAVCLLLIRQGASAHTYFTGTVVVETAAAGLLCLGFVRRGMFDPAAFDRVMFRSAIAFGLPLVIYEGASIVLDIGDRFLVQYYLGADALGRYSVAYGLSRYVNDLVITPLGLAIVPIYMRLWNEAGPEKTAEFLSSGMDLLVMACACIYVLVLVTAHDGLLMLASSKYEGASDLMSMIVGGLLLYTSQVFLSAGLLIQKKTMMLAKLVTCASVIELAFDWVFLPKMGLKAAAIGTFVSYGAGILLIGYASFRVLPLDFEFRRLTRYAVAAVTAWFGASRLQLAAPLLNVLARAVLVVTLYFATLYLLDPRIGRVLRYVLRFRRRSTVETIQGHPAPVTD